LVHAQLIIKKELAHQFSNAYQTAPRRDFSKQPCALIIVKIPLDNVKFVGNVIGATERKDDGYWVYVSGGTLELEIQPGGKYNSIDYKFPQMIEEEGGVQGSNTYVLEIEEPIGAEAPKSSFTLSAGFNVMPFLGPTVSLGFMFKNFCVEAGATYGLSKSADVYIYDKAGALADGYNYSALRGFLRIGYDIWAAPVFAITPQAGAAFNTLSGSRLSEVESASQKVMDGATAISGTVGARLMFAPSGKSGAFRVFLTPEYDFAASKDKNFEALSAFDSKIKSWAEGLNVNLGLLFYF